MCVISSTPTTLVEKKDDRYDLKYICPPSPVELMVKIYSAAIQQFAMEAMAHLVR